MSSDCWTSGSRVDSLFVSSFSAECSERFKESVGVPIKIRGQISKLSEKLRFYLVQALQSMQMDGIFHCKGSK